MPPAPRAKVEPSSASSGSLDLDVGRLEGSAKRLDGVLVELVLDLQRLELGGADDAALLRVVEEGGDGRVGIVGFGAQGKFSQHLCTPLFR